jgi:hypothetical protein
MLMRIVDCVYVIRLFSFVFSIYNFFIVFGLTVFSDLCFIAGFGGLSSVFSLSLFYSI